MKAKKGILDLVGGLGGAGEAGSWLQVLAEAAARPGPGAHVAVLARRHDTLLPEHQARQPDNIF